MASTFNCPTCGAPLHTDGLEANIHCEYCGSSVIVPSELRQVPAPQPAFAAPVGAAPTPLDNDPLQRRAQLRQAMQLIRAGQPDQAAAVLSAATSAPVSTTRPLVDQISSTLGPNGRINPIELMAILGQIAPAEAFWTPPPAYQAPYRAQSNAAPRRRGGGLGCLFFLVIGAILYISSTSPNHLIGQVAVLFNHLLRAVR